MLSTLLIRENDNGTKYSEKAINIIPGKLYEIWYGCLDEKLKKGGEKCKARVMPVERDMMKHYFFAGKRLKTGEKKVPIQKHSACVMTAGP